MINDYEYASRLWDECRKIAMMVDCPIYMAIQPVNPNSTFRFNVMKNRDKNIPLIIDYVRII